MKGEGENKYVEGFKTLGFEIKYLGDAIEAAIYNYIDDYYLRRAKNVEQLHAWADELEGYTKKFRATLNELEAEK